MWPGCGSATRRTRRSRPGRRCWWATAPFVAAVHVMGGAPGTRETDLLAPDKLVQEVDALVLAGGSAFGLDAASGVADALRAAGRGFDVGGQKVPIVPGAIVFDLMNGGDKDWAESPYKRLGRAALAAAAARLRARQRRRGHRRDHRRSEGRARLGLAGARQRPHRRRAGGGQRRGQRRPDPEGSSGPGPGRSAASSAGAGRSPASTPAPCR